MPVKALAEPADPVGMRILAVAGVLATILAPYLADAGEEVSTSDRMEALWLVSLFDDAAARRNSEDARRVFCDDPELRLLAVDVLKSEGVKGALTLDALLAPEMLRAIASYEFPREYVKRDEESGELAVIRRSDSRADGDGRRWEFFQVFRFQRAAADLCVARLWSFDRDLP